MRASLTDNGCDEVDEELTSANLMNSAFDVRSEMSVEFLFCFNYSSFLSYNFYCSIEHRWTLKCSEDLFILKNKLFSCCFKICDEYMLHCEAFRKEWCVENSIDEAKINSAFKTADIIIKAMRGFKVIAYFC